MRCHSVPDSCHDAVKDMIRFHYLCLDLLLAVDVGIDRLVFISVQFLPDDKDNILELICVCHPS